MKNRKFNPKTPAIIGTGISIPLFLIGIIHAEETIANIIIPTSLFIGIICVRALILSK